MASISTPETNPDASVIAVVPARRGSKGIPQKNLQRVGGLSLVARVVRACRAATLIDRVIVSSDEDTILEEARRHGAETLLRPAAIAGDEASSESVLLHALDSMPASPGVLVLVQCTSPFLRPMDIDGVVQAVLDGADSAFTAAASHAFLWRREEGGAVGVNHNPAHRPRRQEREPEFIETGGAYAMRASGFTQHRHRFFGRIALHEVPAETALEIDTPDQLETARLLAGHLDRGPPPAEIDAVIFDFDGVMTDDAVFVDQDGRESVRCLRGDGLGIERLRSTGVEILVLSKERNPVVAARCKKLRIACVQGKDDKAGALRHWLGAQGVDAGRVVYVGNDVNDLPCFDVVGHRFAVADAHPALKTAADWVLSRQGGQGAIREVCEWVLLGLP